MGSHTFRWEHPAEEVFVTGTFDNWTKSTKLDKKDIVHEKTVALSNTNDKVLYKFVADGEWKHDSTGKTETDRDGNINNVIYPEDFKPPSSAAHPISSVGPGATTTEMASEQLPSVAAHTLSSVGPGATTTEMAGEQPRGQASSAPGAFPETPAADDDQTFNVDPIPASEGAGNPIQLEPGEKVPDPSTINDNTVSSTAHDDDELKSEDQGKEQSLWIAPIPATGGAGNPVQLQPGEKVPDPSTLTDNTVESTAKTDQESYEKGDTMPSTSPAGPGTLADRVSPAEGVFGNVSGPGPVIPESGMAMGESKDITKEDTGPAISSVAPGSTTTDLAGQQPIEERGVPAVEKEDNGANVSSVGPDSTTTELAGQQPVEERGVPEVVNESQQETKVDPEASASPDAVEDKAEGKSEDKAEDTTEDKSEDGVGAKVAAGVAAGGAAAAGGAFAANEMFKDKTGTDPKSAMPESVQDTVDEKAKESDIPEKTAGESAPAAAESTTATGEDTTDAARETATSVPEEVTASQKEAGQEPEAAANTEAVAEKSEVEKELLSKVPESDAKGEPAPAAAESTTAAGESTTDAARETTTNVPEEVTASQKEAGQEPEAAANTEAVAEKSEVEKELLSKVPESDAKGEPAPTESAAAATTAPAATTSSTGAPQLEDPTAGVAALSMDDNKAAATSEGGLNADKNAEAAPLVAALAPEESKSPMDSRDVSPMSKSPTGQTQPLVTSGVGSSSTPSKNGPSASGPTKRNSIIEKLKSYPDNSPKKSETSTPSSSTSKKEKRRSFFGKIKDKLKS